MQSTIQTAVLNASFQTQNRETEENKIKKNTAPHNTITNTLMPQPLQRPHAAQPSHFEWLPQQFRLLGADGVALQYTYNNVIFRIV